MSKRRSLAMFAAPPEMVEEARTKLTRECCPRRYCWYWHSLGFDWDMSTEQGCEVEEQTRAISAEQSIPPWRFCCRATGNPQHPDSYEPREPHLLADGWTEDHFLIVGKTMRRRRFERRRRGKGRRTDESLSD